MRQVDYRAWFAKERKMVLVDSLEFARGISEDSTHATVLAKTDFEKGGWYTQLREGTHRKTGINNNTQLVPRVVLMQYTGLKDTADRKIFEEDIVEFSCHSYYKDHVFQGTVLYRPNIASYVLQVDDMTFFRIDASISDITIKGNTFEGVKP